MRAPEEAAACKSDVSLSESGLRTGSGFGWWGGDLKGIWISVAPVAPMCPPPLWPPCSWGVCVEQIQAGSVWLSLSVFFPAGSSHTLGVFVSGSGASPWKPVFNSRWGRGWGSPAPSSSAAWSFIRHVKSVGVNFLPVFLFPIFVFRVQIHKRLDISSLKRAGEREQDSCVMASCAAVCPGGPGLVGEGVVGVCWGVLCWFPHVEVVVSGLFSSSLTLETDAALWQLLICSSALIWALGCWSNSHNCKSQ